jgi:hypothetical protein
MEYAEWKKMFVDGGDKSGLTKTNDGSIIKSGSGRMIEDRSSGGFRRSTLTQLTEEEIEHIKCEILAIGADLAVFSFNTGSGTSYNDVLDRIKITGNVFPDLSSIHPRDLMSERAVIAHEYYGHRAFRGASLRNGCWNDEFRASYIAAKTCPNLSDEDRRYLIMDAQERAREAGVSIKLNDYMRRVLHGY